MSYPEQYIAQLILGHYKGELTASEQEVLDGWLSESPRNRAFFDELDQEDRFFQLIKEEEQDIANGVREQILQKIQSQIHAPVLSDEDDPAVAGRPVHRVHFLRTSWWKYAAAVVVLVGLAALFLSQPAEEPVIVEKKEQPVPHDVLPGTDRAILTLSDGRQVVLDPNASGATILDGGLSIQNSGGELLYSRSGVAVFNTMSTPRGGQYKLTLSDGTRVWLNAASSIRYPSFFSGDHREVTVSGEAYFEVAPDKSKPFHVVIPGGGRIEVLGTHFNVNVYEDESEQATTLVEGSVRVVRDNEKVTLRVGEQALLSTPGSVAAQKSIRVQQANVEQVTAWKNNLFIFNNADLPTLMRQLSRWYDLEVRFEKNVPSRSFQGKMPRDIPLSQVLNALKKVDVNFKISDKTLIVSP